MKPFSEWLACSSLVGLLALSHACLERVEPIQPSANENASASPKEELPMNENMGRNISKVTGWSVQGKVSRSLNKEVSLAASFKDTGPYTATFTITNDGPAASLGAPSALAEATIEWSVEGNTVVRKVSVTDGMSITNVAQGVRIVVRDVSPIAAQYEIDVAVQVTQGVRATHANQPYLGRAVDFFQAIASGGSTVFSIPDNIGVNAFAVLMASPTGVLVPAGSVVVTQQSLSTAILARCDARDYTWIPVIPGAGTVNVANFSGTQVDVSVLWGIDG